MDKPFDVFISYSSKDKVKADAICSHFEGRGIRCWYAPRDIKPGADWAESIINALENSKMLVLVFTGNANTSQQVLREVSTAVTQGMPIVPIKFSEEEPTHSMKYYLATVHWLDAINEKQERAIKLLGDRCELILKTGSHNLVEEVLEEEKHAQANSIKVLGVIMIIGVLLVGAAVYFALNGGFQYDMEAVAAADGSSSTYVPGAEEETKLNIIQEFDKATNAISVESWEQFENLTDEECGYVLELCIVGDQVIPPQKYENTEWDWEDDVATLRIYGHNHNLITDNVGTGMVENMDQIKKCRNLERLVLKYQPIETLEGIEELKNLKELDVGMCLSLKDITSAFDCPELGKIDLSDTKVAIIDGIGKLKKLHGLEIGGTYVKDLSPLDEVDFTYANEHKGFRLSINSDRNLDYTPLENVEKFERLSIDWADYDNCWPHIKAKEITELSAQGFGLNNERLYEISQRYPDIEVLQIQRNPEITDLSMLADCAYLSQIWLSSDMEEAVKSAEQLVGVEVNVDE